MSQATVPTIELTAAAEAEVRRLLKAEAHESLGLRLAVAGGGCSGLSYKVEFTLPEPGDLERMRQRWDR